jgi:arylsulfatase A-like enzyme
VRTLARAALAGAGFGLAVAGVETWVGARQLIVLNIKPPFAILVEGALVEIGVGVLLGVVAAPLLRSPRGRAWHTAALALGWVAVALYASPDSPGFRLFSLLGPVGGLALVLLGRPLGRRRPALPGLLGAAVLLAAIGVPVGRAWLRTPAPLARATPPPARPGAPDVAVVVLDTVRADHVSAYGYARSTTPTFDALAREGALFLDAVSPATWSLPAHASLFTGRFVSGHGAHEEHRFLAAGMPTLAETLAAAGWDTRSFTANAWISDTLGLTRGFAWTDEAWRHGDVGRSFHPAFRLLDRLGLGVADKGGGLAASNFERWAAGRPGDAPPAFAFLNFIEAHFPYHQLPPEYLGRFTDTARGELQTLSMRLFAAQFGDPIPDSGETLPLATAMYDAGILYADHLLGRVVEALRRRGSLDRTVLIVLADHGEMLGEHGEFGHGLSLYEPVLHVPLLVRFPPRIPAGTRVAAPVSTVGVFATVCDLAGVAAPPTLQGPSLAAALDGGGPPRAVLAERYATLLLGGTASASADPLLRADVRFRTLRAGRMKLVQSSRGPAYLFDLAADPGEEHDLAPADPATVGRLEAELEVVRAGLGLAALDAPVQDGAAPAVDPAARERLRALGYVE